MDDGIILHIGTFSDDDPVIVASQNSAEPNAGMLEQPHLSDQRGGWRYPAIAAFRKLRRVLSESIIGHDRYLSTFDAFILTRRLAKNAIGFLHALSRNKGEIGVMRL
jgi:hypothetical protein